MLKMLFASLVVLFSISQASASAFDSIKDQELQASAYGVLNKNAQTVGLEGDIKNGERLTDILKVVNAYTEELEEVILNGGDLEKDMKSNIQHIDIKCVRAANLETAKCALMIQFKPLGETAVEFTVKINAQDQAEEIIGNALVSRGD